MSNISNSKQTYSIFEIDNPKTLNSLDLNILKKLSKFLKNAKKQKHKYIILTGKGEVFSSGVNLNKFSYSNWENNPINLICKEIEELEIPSLCIINGDVFGAGFELALSCDFRIGKNNFKARVPPVKIGINYEPEGIKRMVNILGYQIVKRLLILGETFDAKFLYKIGFLDYLEDNNVSLKNRISFLHECFLENAPLAVSGMKKTLLELSNDSFEKEIAKKRVEKCFFSNDFKEGLNAFKEKRKPIFKGN